METLHQILSDVLRGLAIPLLHVVASGDNRLFWAYLLAAAAISYLLYRRAGRHGDADASGGFLAYLFPAAIWRHRGARTDIGVMLVASVLLNALLAPIIVKRHAVADWLLGLYPAATTSVVESGALIVVLYTVVLFVVDDLTKFLAHYLMHRVPALWQIHKVHHAAEVLTPFTAYRIHPLEYALSATCVAVSIGCTTAAFVIAFGTSISPMTLFNANVGLVAFNLLGGTLRHSHIWFSYGPTLEKIFISPAMHQVHHSAERRHFNRNLGYHLAIWDRLAGTLYIPQGRERFPLGLGAESRNLQTVTANIVWPVLQAARIMAPAAWRQKVGSSYRTPQ